MDFGLSYLLRQPQKECQIPETMFLQEWTAFSFGFSLWFSSTFRWRQLLLLWLRQHQNQVFLCKAQQWKSFQFYSVAITTLISQIQFYHVFAQLKIKKLTSLWLQCKNIQSSGAHSCGSQMFNLPSNSIAGKSQHCIQYSWFEQLKHVLLARATTQPAQPHWQGALGMQGLLRLVSAGLQRDLAAYLPQPSPILQQNNSPLMELLSFPSCEPLPFCLSLKVTEPYSTYLKGFGMQPTRSEKLAPQAYLVFCGVMVMALFSHKTLIGSFIIATTFILRS